MSGESYNGVPPILPAFYPGNLRFPLERCVTTTNENHANVSYVYSPALSFYPPMETLTVPRKRKRTPDSYTEFHNPIYSMPNLNPYGVAPYLTNGYFPLGSQSVPIPLNLNNVNVSVSGSPYLLPNPPPIVPGILGEPKPCRIAPYESSHCHGSLISSPLIVVYPELLRSTLANMSRSFSTFPTPLIVSPFPISFPQYFFPFVVLVSLELKDGYHSYQQPWMISFLPLSPTKTSLLQQWLIAYHPPKSKYGAQSASSAVFFCEIRTLNTLRSTSYKISHVAPERQGSEASSSTLVSLGGGQETLVHAPRPRRLLSGNILYQLQTRESVYVPSCPIRIRHREAKPFSRAQEGVSGKIWIRPEMGLAALFNRQYDVWFFLSAGRIFHAVGEENTRRTSAKFLGGQGAAWPQWVRYLGCLAFVRFSDLFSSASTKGNGESEHRPAKKRRT